MLEELFSWPTNDQAGARKQQAVWCSLGTEKHRFTPLSSLFKDILRQQQWQKWSKARCWAWLQADRWNIIGLHLYDRLRCFNTYTRQCDPCLFPAMFRWKRSSMTVNPASVPKASSPSPASKDQIPPLPNTILPRSAMWFSGITYRIYN